MRRETHKSYAEVCVSHKMFALVTTGLPLHKKIPPYMFEMNKIMFSPNLDMSRGVFGLRGKNKKCKPTQN